MSYRSGNSSWLARNFKGLCLVPAGAIITIIMLIEHSPCALSIIAQRQSDVTSYRNDIDIMGTDRESIKRSRSVIVINSLHNYNQI